MKSIRLSILIICVVGVLFNNSTAKEIQVGEWSEAVNGLQGRIAVAKDAEFNGTKQIAVYLELRNSINIFSPTEIYFEPHKAFKWRIIDRNEKPLAPPSATFASIFSPDSYWLVLPFDSTLRFRVSVSGYSAPANSGTQIQLLSNNSLNGDWLISDKDKNDYFLDGTFISQPPKIELNRQVWQGTLKLPKVSIPHKMKR